MNATHQSVQNPVEQSPDSDAAQLLVRRLAVLDELCAVGMDVVRELPKHAAVTGEDAAIGEVGLTFSRVSRSIRQIIALEQELTGAKEDQKRYARNRVNRERTDAVKRGVRSAVGNAVLRDDPEIERKELRERVENLFDDYNDYDDDDYLRGSVGEAIAVICAGLGIETDPPVWDDAGYTVPDDVLKARRSEAKKAKANFGKSVFPDPPGVRHDEPDAHVEKGGPPHSRRRSANSHDPPSG